MRHAGIVAVAVGLALAVAGCSNGPRYVAVSGVVTLDGKPYKNAAVTFQPMGTKGNQNPGRGSNAYTDENGRFTLKTDEGQNGAVVGKHRIRIMTKYGASQPDGDPKNPPKAVPDPIPKEWHADSTKEFDVLPGGTDQANFNIVTKK